MRKVWIVVANGSQASIYRAENLSHLIEVEHFNHEEAHMKKSEFNSDRPGRATQRKGYGTDTMEEKTPPKEKEHLHFATTLANYLTTHFHKSSFERLYLVSSLPFLGHLRLALDPNVSKLVASEIGKDLTQSRPEQIRDYLPPVL